LGFIVSLGRSSDDLKTDEEARFIALRMKVAGPRFFGGGRIFSLLYHYLKEPGFIVALSRRAQERERVITGESALCGDVL